MTSPDVRLRFTTIRVGDLPRMRAFYEGLLGLAQTAEQPARYVQLQAGGSELCLDVRSETADREPLVVFAVDDIPALRARLNDAGVRIVDYGETYFVAEDPEGNLLAFEPETRKT